MRLIVSGPGGNPPPACDVNPWTVRASVVQTTTLWPRSDRASLILSMYNSAPPCAGKYLGQTWTMFAIRRRATASYREDRQLRLQCGPPAVLSIAGLRPTS